MATHAVFTIVADVHRGAEPELEADLKAFDAATRFVGLPGLHFASFVIFDATCLKRPLSKLVLECAIDGPIGPFLCALDGHCDLSRVFRHCKDYAQAESTLRFLRAHVRKPQLYHVGTPYQSAASILADIRQRDDFDHRLRNAGVRPLDALLRNVPAGMREYWRLEILEPWLALPMAVAGLWLAWLIWSHTNWHGWRQIGPSVLNTLVAVVVVLAAFRYAFISWQSALPQLRRRVMSWIAWLVKGALLGGLTVVVVRVWPRHAVRIELCVLLLFAAVTLYKIYADVSSDRNARLAEVRGNTSIDTAWRALKNTPSEDSEPAPYRLKKWLALLNFLGGATLMVLFWFGISSALSNGFSKLLIVCVAASVVLRAVWLTVRGFRADGLWMEDSHGVAAFLGFSAFVGILAGFVLAMTPPSVGAVVGFAVVFALDMLWNWRWWIAGYPLIYLSLHAMIQSGHTVELYVAITALFFLEAWWLTVLVGWPDRKRPRWSTQSKRFIAGASIGGFVLIEVLLRIHVWSALTAVIIPAALYSLWNVEIDSPVVVDAVRLPPERLNELRSKEDHDVQNHMAALVPLRKAWFRPAVLRSFLWMLNSLFFQAGWLRDWYKGKLFGLPTVHFCQWVLLDDRNYIFLSNYDHSWSTYLDDFGTTIGAGIQKIWGQGEGNPGTASLRAFKDYARSTMVTHADNSWYQAYPGITLRQIWNNEEIRRGVDSATGEEAIVRVLRRFGAAPKTLPEFINAGIR